MSGCPSLDVDADGSFDYQFFYAGNEHQNNDWGLDLSIFQGPLQIVLSPLTETAPLNVVHTQGGEVLKYSKSVDYTNSYSQSYLYVDQILKPDEIVKFFFSTPVEELDNLSASYVLDYDSALESSPYQATDSRAAFSFNAEKTILTISPPESGYHPNQILNIKGNLKPLGDNRAEPQELELDQNLFIATEAPLDIDLIGDNSSRPQLILTKNIKLDSVSIVRKSDGESDFSNSTYYLKLYDAKSLGCTTCADQILASREIYAYFSPYLQAGDQVILTVAGQDIDGEELLISKTLNVKASMDQSDLITP